MKVDSHPVGDTSDDAPLQRYELRFPALGTTCRVVFRSEAWASALGYRKAVMAWVETFEERYSRFRETSLVSQINRGAGDGCWVPLDVDAEEMFGLIDAVHFLSKGVLDPSVLPLTRLWTRVLNEGREPSAREVESTRGLVGWSKVEREPGKIRLPSKKMALDLGGFGKEYAVDRVASLAEGFGIKHVLVDFGRDLRAMGNPGHGSVWTVGVEDAIHPGKVWEKIGLTGKGVASSGDYRRAVRLGDRVYGHLIDCRTGWPVWHDCQAVTVVAESCFQAGILASSAFIVGPEEGRALIEDAVGCEGILQTATRKVESRGYDAYRMD